MNQILSEVGLTERSRSWQLHRKMQNRSQALELVSRMEITLIINVLSIDRYSWINRCRIQNIKLCYTCSLYYRYMYNIRFRNAILLLSAIVKVHFKILLVVCFCLRLETNMYKGTINCNFINFIQLSYY